MSILAILSTIGFGSFQSTRIKANDAKRKSDLSTIAKSLEAYANDHRSYPLSNAQGEIVCPGSTGNDCDWGNVFRDSTGTIYAASLPQESTGGYYRYASTGTDFTLYARLENTEDASIVTLPGIKCSATQDCNYQQKSSNLP